MCSLWSCMNHPIQCPFIFTNMTNFAMMGKCNNHHCPRYLLPFCHCLTQIDHNSLQHPAFSNAPHVLSSPKPWFYIFLIGFPWFAKENFNWRWFDLMLFCFPFPYPFKSCLISGGVSLISWTSLNAWNESEIILIMNIESIQFIKKHLWLNV